MSWIAEYLLVPLVMNRFTAFGRALIGVAESIRTLISDEEAAQPSGPQAQLKVMYCSCSNKGLVN